MQNENVLQKPVVLHFASWYPSSKKPLLGVFIKKHISLLNNHIKQAVIYYNITDDTTSNYHVYHHLNNNLNEIEVVVNKNTPLKPFYIFLGFLSAIKKANDLIGRPSLIHLHTVLPLAPLVWAFTLFSKYKLIITEHWTGYQPEDGNYKGFVKKNIYKSNCKKSLLYYYCI